MSTTKQACKQWSTMLNTKLNVSTHNEVVTLNGGMEVWLWIYFIILYFEVFVIKQTSIENPISHTIGDSLY